MSKNDQAFPGKVVIGIKGDEWVYTHSPGMTLRDWFAGQALSAFNGPPTNEAESQFRAAVAYQLADAMLAERSKP
jgi:hypothetical protein